MNILRHSVEVNAKYNFKLQSELTCRIARWWLTLSTIINGICHNVEKRYTIPFLHRLRLIGYNMWILCFSPDSNFQKNHPTNEWPN